MLPVSCFDVSLVLKTLSLVLMLMMLQPIHGGSIAGASLSLLGRSLCCYVRCFHYRWCRVDDVVTVMTVVVVVDDVRCCCGPVVIGMIMIDTCTIVVIMLLFNT